LRKISVKGVQLTYINSKDRTDFKILYVASQNGMEWMRLLNFLFNLFNPSTTNNHPVGKALPKRTAKNLTTICEPIV
jgi:hypothetical protein